MFPPRVGPFGVVDWTKCTILSNVSRGHARNPWAFRAFLNPNIRQNDGRTKTPHRPRSRKAPCRHQRHPERGPRPVLFTPHVPAWPAGLRGLRPGSLPGGHRKPRPARRPPQKGPVHHAPVAGRRAAGYQGVAHGSGQDEAGHGRILCE